MINAIEINNIFRGDEDGTYILSITLKKGLIWRNDCIMADDLEVFRIIDVELNSKLDFNSAMIKVLEINSLDEEFYFLGKDFLVKEC